MTRRLPASAALATAALLALPSPALAKDLRGRLGVGFNSWFGHVDALSVRYGIPTGDPAINIQVEGDVGFATYEGEADAMFAGGRVLYGVVAEDNMNLYLGAGAGYLGWAGEDLVRIQPGATVDFFLFGLENLGFSAGWGLNIDAGGTTGLSTTSAVSGGLHYWF